MVKIEVNGTKRGVLGDVEILELCQKARDEFQANCKARIVPYSQLYGGKIAAALSRQHPRDLFDFKYMKEDTLQDVKDGLLLCLLGSDRPIVESLFPHMINQEKALFKQFKGMTDITFSYAEYEAARQDLFEKVNSCLNEEDKYFLLSFEQGNPRWEYCSAGDLSNFPSVRWKLKNINKLKGMNPEKFQKGIEKLSSYFGVG